MTSDDPRGYSLRRKSPSGSTTAAEGVPKPIDIGNLLLAVGAAVLANAVLLYLLRQSTLEPVLEICIYAAALCITLTPVLYFFALAPVKKQLTECRTASHQLRAERDYSKRIVDSAPGIVCSIAPDGTTTFINPVGERITGYRSEELVGRNWWHVLYPEEEYRHVDNLFRLLSERDVQKHEMTLTTKDGKRRTISWNVIKHLDDKGELVEIVSFGRDVTQLKVEQDSVAELAKFPSENPNPVLRLALDGTVLYANQPGMTLLCSGGEGGAYEIPEDWRSVLAAAWSERTSKITEIESGDRVLHLTFAPVLEFNYVNVYGSDISDLKRLEEDLRRLSHVDGLTGIPNRRTFNEVLDREWLRARRNKSLLSVIMIDVDDFKRYNDHYGHQQGDQCLRRIAVALTKSLKRPSDFVSRYGGEEFAAILADTDSKGVEAVSEKMRRQVESLNIAHLNSSCGTLTTISLGVASVVPSEGTTAGKLIAAADSALYGSKDLGKNCVSIGYVKGASSTEVHRGH